MDGPTRSVLSPVNIADLMDPQTIAAFALGGMTAEAARRAIAAIIRVWGKAQVAKAAATPDQTDDAVAAAKDQAAAALAAALEAKDKQ